MNKTSEEAYIDDFQMDKLRELMPIVVVMAIICVLGIVDNSFTIAFYGFVARRTPTIFLITVLACVDLVVCIIITAQISRMAVNVKFTNAAGCKIMYFLTHWACQSSASILCLIAIDRYRHVCYRLQKQITFTVAKRAVATIIISSMLLSVHYFANMDILEYPLHKDDSNVKLALGHICSTREDPNYKVSVNVWLSLDAAFVVLIPAILCFTYGRIAWVLKKGVSTASIDNNGKKCKDNATVNDVYQTNSNMKHTASHENDGLPSKPSQANISRDQQVTSSIDNSKIKSITRSVTLMMFVVSVVFCICFVPYVINVMTKILSSKSAALVEFEVGPQIAAQLLYINSVANPIVFCCFNPQFRRYIKRFIQSVMPGSNQTRITIPENL